MAGTDDKVQIGSSADYLEGVSVDTSAGTGLFREGVVISDPVAPDARANVQRVDTLLTGGHMALITHSVVQGRTTGMGGGYVDVKVTPSGALTVNVDGIPSGTAAYAAGTAATVNVPAAAKVTMISAHATTPATITIGSGATIPLPANMGFSDGSTPYVGPLAIVFTGTDSHYVAWVT